MDLFDDFDNGGDEGNDIFSWLMNDGHDDPVFGQQGDYNVGGSYHPPPYAPPVPDPPTNDYVDDPMRDMDPGFGWADGLVPDNSNKYHNNSFPLTDDLEGAMDVIMSGGVGDTGTQSQVNAMYEFASEAASGVRRRGGSTYYQNQDVYRQSYDRQPYRTYKVESDEGSPAMGLRSGSRNTTEPIPTHKNGQPMSPKSIAQREKNREAVRNCRKRKREYAQKLKEREISLEEENTRLKLQLKLGSEDMQNQQGVQCLELAETLKQLIDNHAPTENFNAIVDNYQTIHASQTRNREEATKHIVSRIIRQVEPTHVTKMYLWQMTQSEAYFRSSGGLWEELGTRLNLTHEQKVKLKTQKPHTLEICKEIAAILKQLEFMHSSIIEKKNAEEMVKLFNSICGVLDINQRAKFITLLHREKHQMLMETDWLRFLMSFDPEVDQEHVDRAGDWIIHNPSSSSVLSRRRSSLETSTEDEDALSRKRHLSARVLRELFERSEDELRDFATQAFAPDIHLYDPNIPKGRVIKGIDALLKYIKRIRLSFSGLTAKEETFMTRKNLGRGRWTASGVYFGSKKNNLSERDRKVIEQGSHIAKLAPEDGRPVSFKVVVALKYMAGSAKIQQVMVSWAALEIMRQLGLLGTAVPSIGDRMSSLKEEAVVGTQGNAGLKNGSKHNKEHENTTKISEPLPPLDQKLKETMCVDLTRIFESDSVDERLELAADLLDDNCVSQDANMGGAAYGPDGFIDYVRRLRRPFSTLRMTKHNFVGLKKKKKSKVVKKEEEPPGDDATLQFGCLVNGLYTGALTTKEKPFEFNVTIFVSFNPATNKIAEIEMSWNAASLMRQLGVLH